jgi:hypothetical protein
MVVLAAHVVGVIALEPERDAVLIVDANAEGTGAITLPGGGGCGRQGLAERDKIGTVKLLGL